MGFAVLREDVPPGRFSALTLLASPRRVRHGTGSGPARRRQAGPTGRLDAGPGRVLLAAPRGSAAPPRGSASRGRTGNDSWVFSPFAGGPDGLCEREAGQPDRDAPSRAGGGRDRLCQCGNGEGRRPPAMRVAGPVGGIVVGAGRGRYSRRPAPEPMLSRHGALTPKPEGT